MSEYSYQKYEDAGSQYYPSHDRQDFDRAVESIVATPKDKGTADPPARGPKPTLSSVQIAGIAIRAADRDGLDVVSMQRIAGQAGVTTMALYRYFSSKIALIDLMIDIAGGPPPRMKREKANGDPIYFTRVDTTMPRYLSCASLVLRGNNWSTIDGA